MKARDFLFSIGTALALLTATASADQAKRVTWQPGSSGSCENCNLFGRQMPFWDLTDARYDNAILSRASLHGAKANGAVFNGSKAHHSDFSKALLNSAHFVGAQLQFANFSDAEANGADFTDANMEAGDFRDAKLVGANLSNIIADRITARGADFSAANAAGARFNGANLSSAIFNGTILTEASFDQTNLQGASFRDAQLLGTKLANSLNFQTADFSGACRSSDTTLPQGLQLPVCEMTGPDLRPAPYEPARQ